MTKFYIVPLTRYKKRQLLMEIESKKQLSFFYLSIFFVKEGSLGQFFLLKPSPHLQLFFPHCHTSACKQTVDLQSFIQY